MASLGDALSSGLVLLCLPALCWADDVPAKPAQSFCKGMTVSCQTSGWEWATPEMARTLDELKSLGVNSVAIHPYAQIQNDGHVRFRSDDSFRHITVPLDWARQRGMSAMLIPHIAYWGTKFLWRGEINFASTEEWDRFFGDYENWIVQMARLAQAHGAQTFCIGLEFTYAQKFDARWRKIIAAIRQVYHGKLTYGGNWDSFQVVPFWDALDYIGVLAYFPLTKSPDPSKTEIAAAWQKKCDELTAFSKAHGDKKFLFVEIGYNVSARAAAEPWAFKMGGPNANEIQQRCIEVALDLPRRCPTIAGMYWWKWFPELPSREEENYRLQTPAIKALIAKHWKETPPAAGTQ
jgi:Glycoside Hydrolase Family 113